MNLSVSLRKILKVLKNNCGFKKEKIKYQQKDLAEGKWF